MKLFNTLVMDGGTGDYYSIGIFTSDTNALLAFHTCMIRSGCKTTLMDKGIVRDETIYYYKDYETDIWYVLTITPMVVDENYG